MVRLGSAPREHRTDSLSAAFRNLDLEAQKNLTARYEDLCGHYRMTPTRNTGGLAHENGSIEGPHGHLKLIEDALLMQGTSDYDDLAAYRHFIDEIVGRRNARKAKRIDIERAKLKTSDRRTSDYEQVTVRVTCSGGFTLRKVFYTVPSRLIGHRLRVRLYDDRLDVFIGGSHLMTLPRGQVHANGKHDQVVNYRHVILAPPQADGAPQPRLSGSALPPAKPYRRTFDALLQRLPEKQACRIVVDLLALAHDRGCEAGLADLLAADLSRAAADMSAVCPPRRSGLPHVVVHLVLTTYEDLARLRPGRQRHGKEDDPGRR